jgi:sugar phosphate isomerase/epimerase
VAEPLRIGISSGHFEWKTLEEAFKRCREGWGFDVLEIWSDQIGFPPDRETSSSLRRLSAAHGMALSFHAPFVGQYDLAQADSSRSAMALNELIGVCGRIHAEFLVVHLGSSLDKEAGLRGAMSALAQNQGMIEKLRLKVVVEVVPTLWGHQVGDVPEDFERLFRTIDRSWLGFNLDFGHAQLNRNLDALIDRLGHKLMYAHVQDTRGDLDEHLGYGMGIIDWPRALRRALATGFRGPFVIEFPEFHGLERIDRFLSDLRAHAAAADGPTPPK